MPTFETVKNFGHWTKRIVRLTVTILGTAVIVLGLSSLVYFSYYAPILSPKEVAIQHELQAQASELEHRIQACNNMIDGMVPGTNYMNAAASHCALMWMQMKRLQAFVDQYHFDHSTIQPLVESSFRSAGRYAEYQKAMNRPQYHSSDSDE